jgi:hypothetical protein
VIDDDDGGGDDDDDSCGDGERDPIPLKYHI